MHSLTNIELLSSSQAILDVSVPSLLLIRTLCMPLSLGHAIAACFVPTPLSVVRNNAELDPSCLQIFVPFHESHILPGTVIGLKNNLPNLASANETQRRVISSDGILCSRYFTGLLLRDARSNVNCLTLVVRNEREISMHAMPYTLDGRQITRQFIYNLQHDVSKK